MPETKQLIASVDKLQRSVESLTSQMGDLITRVDVDRRFRRWVTFGVVVAVMWSVALSGWAGYEVATERVEACRRSNDFRRDLYQGVDAVLDSITRDATPEVQATVSDAKSAIREQVPIREDC